MKLKRFVYDIETLKTPDETMNGWTNPFEMGFGSAVVYDYTLDYYHFFSKDDKQHLIDLMKGQIGISFNGIHFDNEVLGVASDTWHNIDLLVLAIESKFNMNYKTALYVHGTQTVFDGTLSLDHICRNTIFAGKSGIGALAPDLIRKKLYAKLFAYNLQDVRLTRYLYEYVIRHGYVVDKNKNTIILNL